MRAEWIVASVLVALPGGLSAMDVPQPVAPGSNTGVAVVRGTCPTFHWSEVDRARSYDLALFRVGSNGVTAKELYRVSLPGGAQGWTPTVERCLLAGKRYAWTLRAVSHDGNAGQWSDPRLFEIAAAPSIGQVEQALTVLQLWLEEERKDDTEVQRLATRLVAEPQSEVERAQLNDPDAARFLAHLSGADRGSDAAPPVNAAAPSLGTASMTLDEQLHLGTNSHIFKSSEVLLWDDSTIALTAFGRNALGLNTTGTDNTAVGYIALDSNTSGQGNTAVGSRAMIDNTTGSFNVAVGWLALEDNSTGSSNTALGIKALHSNTTGGSNTGVGVEAIGENSTGQSNSAVGFASMHDNSTGSFNAANGFRSLRVNTTGDHNTAVGNDALFANTTGSRNTAVGNNAGLNATVGNDNIYLGSGAEGVAGEGNTIRIGGTTVGNGSQQQDRTFVNGITGVNVSGAAVLVSASGQLGVAASSHRFKQSVQDMGETSRRLLDLRPVTFHYRDGSAEGPWPLEFGLIAEEVAEVFPELVVYDDQSRPQTVKYHLLASILLNELQLMEGRFEKLGNQIEALEERNLDQERRLRSLGASF